MSRAPKGRADAESQSSPPPSTAAFDARCLVAFLAGPIAWAVDLTLSYLLVPTVKGWGTKWPVHLVTLLAVAIVVAGILAGLAVLRRPDAGASDARAVERARFLAVGGLASSAFFLLVIAAESVPKLMLGARQ
jgi:hypothetical protein